MLEMPANVREIEKISWDSLREMAAKELSTIPITEQVVFETMFGRKWSQFEQMISALAGKRYEEVSPVHEKMAMLGDLSQAEVAELATIATLNKTRYKSSKVAYWQICRLLHTKRK